MSSRAGIIPETPAALLIRYILASLTALGVDYATFVALLHLAMPPVPAAAIGYAAGIVVHWLASTRLVFTSSVSDDRAARARQKLLFMASGLAGLATTSCIMTIGAVTGTDPRFAKLAAVGASFATTWLLRRHIVFAGSSAYPATP